MSLLSNFFRSSKKVNNTPDVTPLMPSQINPEMYGTLSKKAKDYTNGVGTGFGDSYVSSVTNPIIQASQRRFQNETVPFISSQASARGLGRSSIATDQLNKAGQEQQSQVDQLMAQFYNLNQTQKKSDERFGVGLGSDILSKDTSAQHDVAAASERLAERTAADTRQRESQDNAKVQQFGQSAVALGQSFLPMPSMTPTVGPSQIPQMGQIGNNTGSPQILGRYDMNQVNQMNPQQIQQLLQSLYGA